MKKTLLGLSSALALAATLPAQTIFVPGGTVGSISGSNVGIGTSSPGANLEVNVGSVSGWARSLNVIGTSNSGYPYLYIGDSTNHGLTVGHTNSGAASYGWLSYWGLNPVVGQGIIINSTGNVGIGTTSPGTYKLAVNGTIHTTEVVVDNIGWPDYVFEKDYRLAPLSEVERHIKAEKHLPGIPSAQEVAEHGVSVGEMQSKLLAKVEELTLHLIAQEKEIAALKARLVKMESGSVQNHE